MLHAAAAALAATAPGATRRRRLDTLTITRWPPNDVCYATGSDSSKMGCSEQVHLALGGQGEVVVSFATLNDLTSSTVQWWPDGGTLEDEAAAKTSAGASEASSSLQSVDTMLTHHKTTRLAMSVTAITTSSELRDQTTITFDQARVSPRPTKPTPIHSVLNARL